MKVLSALAAAALALGGCATGYHANGPGERFTLTQEGEDLWHLSFEGNTYTNRLTVQSYWLYRGAELALAQGYDGFEVLSGVGLPGTEPEAGKLRQSTSDGGLRLRSYEYYEARLAGDIRLLNRPLPAQPPRVFDAARLKSALDPFVEGGLRCDRGNVCPHHREYLSPPISGV